MAFAGLVLDDKRYHQFREVTDSALMALKNTQVQTLTDQQRIARLAKLCEELQSAVDQAGDHRRLLQEVQQTAQELLTDEETKPRRRKKKNSTD